MTQNPSIDDDGTPHSGALARQRKEQEESANQAAGLRPCGHPLGTTRVCYDCEIAEEKARFRNRR